LPSSGKLPNLSRLKEDITFVRATEPRWTWWQWDQLVRKGKKEKRKRKKKN